MFDSLKQAYMPKTEFPTREIDHSKCKKCGRCFDACPTYGYKWSKGKYPEPVGYGGFEQACLNCGNCTAVCPSGAITMNGAYEVLSGRYKTLLLSRMNYPDPLGLKGKKDFKDFESKLTEVERVIYKRRSNRLFMDKEVPVNILKRILEAGRFAPSAGNCQPYKFIVVTDKKIISELETLSMDKGLRSLKNAYLAKEGKRRLWKKIVFSLLSWFMVNNFDQRPITAIEKADKTDDKIYFNAPAVIIILKNRRGISNPDFDAGICVQNMTLAAHSLGLGTCIISLPIIPLSYPAMSKFRKKIDIASPYEAVTSIAVGYPQGKIDGVVKRDTPPVVWIDG